MHRFSIVLAAGLASTAAFAQGTGTAGMGDVSSVAGNSLSSHSAAMGGAARNGIVLNAARSDLSSAAASVASTNAIASLASPGASSVKLGQGAGLKGPDEGGMFKNALGPASLAAAIGANTAAPSDLGSVNAVAVIGATPTGNLSGLLGDSTAGAIATQRIGR